MAEKGKKTTGKNVTYEVSEKNVLTITVDLNKDSGKSKSGKTTLIGSTNGNTKITDAKDNEVIMGLNVYCYGDDDE